MNGALLIDKPAGVTSHDIVAIVRRALKEGGASRPSTSRPAVGHTGTLDPFATGLLVVLTGKATRLARFLDGMPKVYRATVRFGASSDTDDATGTLSELRAPSSELTVGQVGAALAAFVGTQQQLPPAYSAKKIDGQRAYARARKGEEVVLKSVEVTIHSAELIGYAWPDAEIRVSVSTGTYIRALARDLGMQLGVPAHCAALRREAIGTFQVRDAQPIQEVLGGLAAGRHLTPLQVIVHLPRQEVTADEVVHLVHGRQVEARTSSGPLALCRGDELIAIAEVQDGKAQPVVVLAE